jgi:hypothetical protein
LEQQLILGEAITNRDITRADRIQARADGGHGKGESAKAGRTKA